MIISRKRRPLYHCLFGIDDAIVGGVLGIAGDLFGASMASSAQSSAIQANREMQERNIAWEKEQLQNKHQWEVSDLRSAGLNPILSAPNASSAVSAGSPSNTPVKPEFQLSRTLEALSNSALMQKQLDIASFDAETRRISANAQYLDAKVKENTSSSAIALNESSRYLNLMNADRIKNLWPMEVTYAKAKVDYTTQQIINSIIETQAKAQYYEKAGNAALTSAQAQMVGAQAQQAIAATMEKNGVSQRVVNDFLAGKYNQDIQESISRMQKITTEDKSLNWQLQKDMTHNPLAAGQGDNVTSQNFLFGLGEFVSNAIGIGGLLK